MEAEQDRILAALLDWLRIPSISSHPDRAADVMRSAEFCAGLSRVIERVWGTPPLLAAGELLTELAAV